MQAAVLHPTQRSMTYSCSNEAPIIEPFNESRGDKRGRPELALFRPLRSTRPTSFFPAHVRLTSCDPAQIDQTPSVDTTAG